MTHSAAVPPRKPSRLGLYLPWGIGLVLIIGWSLWWLWLSAATGRRIDEAAASLRAHGGHAAWTSRRIYGYPFRLDVDFTGLTLADASGWSLALPTLKGEAPAFEPDHWIVGTVDGATLTPPGGTPLTIVSPQLHASVNSWDQHPARFSFVGDDLTFAAAPGAPPFPLASARDVQLYTRAGPADQGAFRIEIDGGAATPGTDLAGLAAGKPVTLTVDGIFSHASAIAGPDWRTSVTGWSRQGGAISVQHIAFVAGGVSLDATAGQFGVDANGDLAGSTPAQLRTAAGPASTTLSAREGVLWLAPATPARGQPTPVRLGPAPRAF